MLTLYYAPFTCSLAPHIALREAELPFELVCVDKNKKRTQYDEDFLAINPKGYVPALRLDDGVLLTEGAAILQYIADRRPERGLAPPLGTRERYCLMEWLSFISTELHKGFSPLFAPSTPDALRDKARTNLQKQICIVESTLAHKPYLMGEQFSVADAYAYVVLRWTRWVHVDLSAFPATCEFQKRIAERPAVKAAMEREQQKRNRSPQT